MRSLDTTDFVTALWNCVTVPTLECRSVGNNTHTADTLIHGHDSSLGRVCTSPLNPQTLLDAGVTATAATLATAERKHEENYPKCSEQGWVCIPVVAESYGASGKEATQLFNCFKNCHPEQKTKSASMNDIYGCLNLQLVKANA